MLFLKCTRQAVCLKVHHNHRIIVLLFTTSGGYLTPFPDASISRGKRPGYVSSKFLVLTYKINVIGFFYQFSLVQRGKYFTFNKTNTHACTRVFLSEERRACQQGWIFRNAFSAFNSYNCFIIIIIIIINIIIIIVIIIIIIYIIIIIIIFVIIIIIIIIIIIVSIERTLCLKILSWR